MTLEVLILVVLLLNFRPSISFKRLVKKDAVGRPNLYATTDYFLDYMGINSLDELVAIDQLELEEQETSLFREDTPEELEDSDN
mgnify:CR=1 FL=1